MNPTRRLPLTLRLAICLLGWGAASGLGLGDIVRATDDIDYARDIRPILAKRCYACHGPLQQKQGLRVDTAALAARGGESGAAIVPGKPDESLLIQAVTGKAGFRMPPEGEGAALTKDEQDRLRRWIAAGARGPVDEQPEPDPRQHWSYRPVARPAVPTIQRRDWPLDSLDNFIAAGHESHGLTPRPRTTPELWLRRAWVDLVGVLPPREVVEEFVADDGPDAEARVVDRLLAHPFHGERWGRHWMDVWRYSDWYGSRGINEIRYSQRHIWRWRDWIVESLNHDKPYQSMVVEMLAGDESDPANPDVTRATGFIGRNWYKFDRNVWMFDAVEHTAQAFLSLTIRCSRCHDHKYDPISQEDYYRFRAFFEPHEVRTDTFSANAEQEKDATLGLVPKEGVARVYDKALDVPTYVFQRGDNRYPDESRRMPPGVPSSLGGPTVRVEPVSLPVESFYPALRPSVAAGFVRKAQADIEAAGASIDKARQEAQNATEAWERRRQEVAAGRTEEAGPNAPWFHDTFAAARPNDWQTISGEWVYENGRLVEKAVQNFATLVTKANHPRDFRAKIRYRTLAPGSVRSVGFSFDYVDQGNSQDVYTSTGDAGQSIQAFHRLNGQQHYPPAGIVKTSLRVGDETTVEIEVRGQQLTIWLNGEKKLDYVCPVPRREGRFALWVHSGAAEFLELEVRPLVATLADLNRARQIAADRVVLAELKRQTTRDSLAALEARIAAERAKYGGASPEAQRESALAASRAERQVAVAQAEEALRQAEQFLELARATAAATATPPAPAGAAPAASAPPAAGSLADAEQKVAAARTARDTAVSARDNPDGKYAPLGELFPTTSTGRRLALARWIAHADNPRASRVAVNHVWLRHFGQALVPSVANFGLNGERPTHPELLDHLASEFVADDWNFKRLHRRLVLSQTYALSTAEGDNASSNVAQDRTNRFYWRMHSRRMEAEAVRDSVLFAAGLLDTRQGGPEIPEGEGQTNPRRSLYFRLTPNEKMKFLELFDVADPNACYRRRESVVPQQSLAMLNSPLGFDAARQLAAELTRATAPADSADSAARFIQLAFQQLLGRPPLAAELAACQKFLDDQRELARQTGGPAFPSTVATRLPPSTDPAQRAREDLIHVLFSHNDYVTVR